MVPKLPRWTSAMSREEPRMTTVSVSWWATRMPCGCGNRPGSKSLTCHGAAALREGSIRRVHGPEDGLII